MGVANVNVTVITRVVPLIAVVRPENVPPNTRSFAVVVAPVTIVLMLGIWVPATCVLLRPFCVICTLKPRVAPLPLLAV